VERGRARGIDRASLAAARRYRTHERRLAARPAARCRRRDDDRRRGAAVGGGAGVVERGPRAAAAGGARAHRSRRRASRIEDRRARTAADARPRLGARLYRISRHAGASAPRARPAGDRAARRSDARRARRRRRHVHSFARRGAARHRCSRRRVESPRGVPPRGQSRAAVESDAPRTAHWPRRPHRSAPHRARHSPRRARHGRDGAADAAARASRRSAVRHWRARSLRRERRARRRRDHRPSPDAGPIDDRAAASLARDVMGRTRGRRTRGGRARRRAATAAARRRGQRAGASLVDPRETGTAPPPAGTSARALARARRRWKWTTSRIATGGARRRSRRRRDRGRDRPCLSRVACGRGALQRRARRGAAAAQRRDLFRRRSRRRGDRSTAALLRSATAARADDRGRGTHGAPCRVRSTRRRLASRGDARVPPARAPAGGGAVAMVPGVSGSLISGSFLESLTARTHVPPSLAAQIAAALRRGRASCGAASPTRALLQSGAEPIVRSLGFERSADVGERAPCIAATLAGDRAAVALLVAPFGVRLDPLWPVAVVEARRRRAEWALLYNGIALRLVDATRLHARRHLDFDLDLASASGGIAALALTIAASALGHGGAGSTRALVAASDAHGSAVCRSLRNGVLDASAGVLEALVAARRRRPPAMRDSFEQALTIVYRDSYSVEALRAAAEQPAGAPGLWDALRAMTRLAHAGCDAGDLRVTPFNGRLFAPSRTPLAERRDLDDEQAKRAVLALSTRAIRANGSRERITYRDLGVEQLGAVYETLLDYEPHVADGHVTLRPESGVRHATGTFYTPQPIAESLVRR